MKFLSTLFIFAATASAFAQDKPLALYLDCPTGDDTCIELSHNLPGSGLVKLKREPEMTISPADIQSAWMGQGQFGEETLNVQLNGPASKRLEDVTSKNINRTLAIVLGETVLINPTIKSAITAGSFQITRGLVTEDSPAFADSWLMKMAKGKSMLAQKLAWYSMIAYMILSTLLIGGAIYWVFFRTKAAEA